MSESAEKTPQEKIAQLKKFRRQAKALPVLAVLFAVLSIFFDHVHGGVPGWYSWWVRIALIILAVLVWWAVCIVCDVRIKRHKKRLRKQRQQHVTV